MTHPQRQWCILASNEIMVENVILLERVTHELSGDMTHDPTKIQNPPKIDDFTQFRNFSKGY